MKKLLFALLVFMVASVYAEEITLTATDKDTSICSYTDKEHWSDGFAPQVGLTYATGKKNYLNMRAPEVGDSLEFAGDKLTINSNSRIYIPWYTYPNNNTYLDYPITIKHLVLEGSSSQVQFSESGHSDVGNARYLLRGKLEVTNKLSSWPSIFRLGQVSGAWVYNEMELVGEDTAYFQIDIISQVNGSYAIADANDKTKVSETAMVGMDFNGELSGYKGTIMVGTNVAVRIGGVMENGKVVLSGAQSAIGSSAEFGGVLKTLECRNKGILLASPKYEQLYVTESFTKNGKMKVRLFDGGEDIMYRDRVNVITVPISAGITVNDFELEEPTDALSLEVIDEGETLTLSIVNAMPVDEFDPIGYVQLYEDDQREFFSPSADASNTELFNLYSYHFAGNWDNDEKPTADNDYYVGPGRRFYFCNAGTLASARDVEEGKSASYYWQHVFFYGKSLTIGGIGFFNVPDSGSNGYSMTIPDLRLLSGAKFTFAKKDGSAGNPYQARFGNTSSRGITKVTVEAKKVWPVVFESGTEGKDYGGYLFEKYTKFIGESDAGIKLVGSVSKPTDRGWTAFIGDMSEYYGTIMLGERQNLILGTDSMPGKIEVLASATEGIIISNMVNVVSLGGLTTHGALNVTLRGNVKLAIGESQFGGIVNFICNNFKPGDIVAGSGATVDNVRVNGQQVKVLEGSGALYLNDVSELGIEGTGTKTDPYVISSSDIRAILSSAKGEKIYILPEEALPVKGMNNNTRRDTYIAKYRGYYVDNYNAESASLFIADTGANAYNTVGSYTGKIGGNDKVTVPFWSDALAPHAGADYVVYPEVWGTTIYAKDLNVDSNMQEPFAGDSLMMMLECWLQFYDNDSQATIGKLVMMPDSGFKMRSVITDTAECKLFGVAYIRGFENHPVRFYAGAGAKSFAFEGTLVSEPTGMLQLEAATSLTASFTGDMEGYRGKIVASTNATVRLVDSGLVNGTVELAHEKAKLLSNGSGRIVVLKKLTAKANATIEVPAGEVMRIEAVELDDGVKITKEGEGVLLLPDGVSGVVDESGAIIAGTSMEAIPENGNGLSYRDSYALGLKPTDVNSKPFINKRQVSAIGKLALGLDNVKVNPASGVKFTLKVSDNGVDNFQMMEGQSDKALPEFEIDLPNEKVRYYKIEYSFK